MPRIFVDVTKEDIDRGKQGSGCECPLALAISRALGIKVYVDGHGVEVGRLCSESTGLVKIADSTDLMTDFMLDFDKGRPGLPFSFYLELREKKT